MTWVAVLLAVAGACCYAFGARHQNTAVRGNGGLGPRGLLRLLRDRGWLTGLLLLGAGTALHVTAVALAPLTVVQPIGALALALTAVLHARARGIRLNRASVAAIVACIGGVATFVALATGTVRPAPVTGAEALRVLALMGAAAIALGLVIGLTRAGRARALGHIVAAGVAFGFVATLTRVLSQRVREDGLSDPFLLVPALAVAASLLAGGWCLQQAHAGGPPDLVVAGLTVIDPLVAVAIGITVLGEAPYLAPANLAALAGAAVVAAGGVAVLARHHPDTARTEGPAIPDRAPVAYGRRGWDTETFELRSIS